MLSFFAIFVILGFMFGSPPASRGLAGSMIQPHSGGEPLRLGTAQLDRVSQVASCGGRTIALTVLESRLLTLLGEAEGRLLTRAEILEFVWNDTSDVRTRVVDVHVAALRKKLAQVNAPLEIVSVRGIGYRLDTK